MGACPDSSIRTGTRPANLASTTATPKFGAPLSKVTIEDISKATGLSRGTVSRALNNRPDISVQTKQRVLDACRELNYVPSYAARTLATGRSYNVAVVLSEVDEHFGAAFLRGVLQAAHPERYAVQVIELGKDADAAMDYLHAVAHERVDAVLFAVAPPIASVPRLMGALGGRTLVCAATANGLDADCLLPDTVEAGRLIARRLALVDPDDGLFLYESARAAQREAAAGFREVAGDRTAGGAPTTLEAASSATLEHVHERLARARAVGAASDALAMRVLWTCQQLGRRPGVDVAVIGLGNEPCTSYIYPGLSSVDMCGQEIGSRAFDLALQRVTKTRQDGRLTTPITPRLIERASSRLAPPADAAAHA